MENEQPLVSARAGVALQKLEEQDRRTLGSLILVAFRRSFNPVLPQAVLAARYGVSKVAVHRWETGERMPTHARIMEMHRDGLVEHGAWYVPAPTDDSAVLAEALRMVQCPPCGRRVEDPACIGCSNPVCPRTLFTSLLREQELERAA